MPLTILPEPVSAVFAWAAKQSFAAYQRQQAQIAREELLRAMRKGRPWVITDDKTAAAALQYVRAYQEGSARQNLRLIAEALCESAQHAAFSPDTFKKQSAALATLSYQEILVTAALAKSHRWLSTATEWQNLKEAGLWHSNDPRQRAYHWWVAELKNHVAFVDQADVAAHCASLIRTGWVVPMIDRGEIFYSFTRQFEEVALLLDFDDVAAERMDEPG